MGLDMYLSKRTYVKNWDHMSDSQKHNITVKQGDKIREDIKPERISYITEEVGYWRKFNALHNYIVQNCADGVDNCQEIEISKDEMKELLEVLIKVHNMKNTLLESGNTEKLNDLFPTSKGFFFGSTEYDEYYFQDVKDTIELFTELLKEEKTDYFTYQASW